MRLLERNNDGEFSLTKDFGDHVPQYAILSHTWGADTEEFTFRDLMDGTGKSKAGYGKIRFCGEQARRDGLDYFWVDTCCIDKSNNTELAEAINSMFRWYRESTKCYVYLSDVSITKPNTSTLLSEFTWESAFRASRWFTRGWTLQELIAPDSVEFFSREGERLGDKKTLEQQVHEITGIAVLALQGAPLSQFGVDERLLWAENRQTARKEDKAYSLLGIFNVYMPLIYGEGRDNALIRLREEIDKPSRRFDRLSSPKQHELYITEGTSYRPLKYSCPNFTGRADFISRLRDFFGPETTSRLRRRDFVLYGLGGCGKTQICLKFAEESTHMFWKIFWIDATSATTLDLSFREIALDPAATYDGVEDSMDSIIRWLSRQNKEWLVIFDNADEEPETVERFLAPSNRGNTLITSRNPNMRQLVHEGAFAQVEQMEEGEAISLLSTVAHITNPSDETLARLRLIVNELGFIPLAIRHAGVAIAHGFCNYRDYLEMFRQHPLRLLAHPSFKGASQYNLNLIATWETSLVAIQGNAVTEGGQVLNSALHIFRIFSFFHPNGITDDIFRRAASFGDALPPDENFSPALGLPEARDHLPRHILPTHEQGGWDPIIFKEAIRMLLKHSFIQIDVSNGVYSVHPLVQYWARHRMTKEEQGDAFRTATALLATAAGSRGAEDNYTFRRQLIPHVHALYQFRVETGLPDHYYDDASNYFWILYEENEYWKDAEKLGQKVMEKRLGVLGETHPSTVESMARLALTLRQLGLWEGAEKLQQKALAYRRKFLGEGHTHTLESMTSLAMIYFDQARYEDAQKLQLQVFETQTNELGDDDRNTIKSATALGQIYLGLGKCEEAATLLEPVVQSMKNILDSEILSTVEAMACLAAAYHALYRLDEAEKLKLEVLKARKKIQGDKHPATLMAIANLAATYVRQERLNTAVDLVVPLVATRKEVLGERHRDTLTTLLILTNIYIKKSMWDEAEDACIQVIEGRVSVLPLNHPHTIWSKAHLALIYHYQGRLDEASAVWEDVVLAQEEVRGSEHEETLLSIHNLALVRKSQGQAELAFQLMTRARDSRRKTLGQCHYRTLESDRALQKWQLSATVEATQESPSPLSGRPIIRNMEAKGQGDGSILKLTEFGADSILMTKANSSDPFENRAACCY